MDGKFLLVCQKEEEEPVHKGKPQMHLVRQGHALEDTSKKESRHWQWTLHRTTLERSLPASFEKAALCAELLENNKHSNRLRNALRSRFRVAGSLGNRTYPGANL